MTAHIYIHSHGQIVEKCEIEYDTIDDLREIAEYAVRKYKSDKDRSFCISIMIM